MALKLRNRVLNYYNLALMSDSKREKSQNGFTVTIQLRRAKKWNVVPS